MKTSHAGLALLLLLGAAGCGKELVVGGQKEVETYATGDGSPEGGVRPARVPVPGLGPADSAVTIFFTGSVQGSVSFDATVELVTASGGTFPAGSASSSVGIEGRDTTLVARASVPRTRYRTVRITFTEVRANVVAGLVVGGIEVTGTITVADMGGPIVVESQLPVDDADEPLRVLVDFDASAWLAATNPATRTVPASAFQSAVDVVVDPL